MRTIESINKEHKDALEKIKKDDEKRSYVKRDSTKIISAIKDKRALEDQFRELRGVTRCLCDAYERYSGIPLWQISVKLNQNPTNGNLKNFVDKYTDEGDVKNV